MRAFGRAVRCILGFSFPQSNDNMIKQKHYGVVALQQLYSSFSWRLVRHSQWCAQQKLTCLTQTFYKLCTTQTQIPLEFVYTIAVQEEAAGH